MIFSFRGEGVPWARIQKLTLPTAVFKILHFPVPRPRALLGDQHFRRFLGETKEALNETGRKNYRTVVLDAAGRESTVMQRLAGELASNLMLRLVDKEGDLAIRVRPAVAAKSGWEVLVRLGHRPLSARAWRVADMAGALNGPVAALLNRLADIQPADRLLNVACGSGTLIIELHKKAKMWVGGDIDSAALALARQNLAAAGIYSQLIQFNGEELPFPNLSFDVLTADLPWGQLVGTQQDNRSFYPAFLEEADRVLKPGGRLVVLTHDVRRFRQARSQAMEYWETKHDFSIKMGKATPRVIIQIKR